MRIGIEEKIFKLFQEEIESSFPNKRDKEIEDIKAILINGFPIGFLVQFSYKFLIFRIRKKVITQNLNIYKAIIEFNIRQTL